MDCLHDSANPIDYEMLKQQHKGFLKQLLILFPLGSLTDFS